MQRIRSDDGIGHPHLPLVHRQPHFPTESIDVLVLTLADPSTSALLTDAAQMAQSNNG